MHDQSMRRLQAKILEAKHAARLAEAATKGWVAPVYKDSKICELDQHILSSNRCVCFRKNAPELEYYKVLRTQLMRKAQEKGWKTFMITSARPGEGKTLTSINLALTFAKLYNHTVLLVDFDLRQQKIHRYLGIVSGRGIVDHLEARVDLKEIIIWPGIEKMTLISGGRTVNESAELLESPRMKSLVAEMKSRYADRFILIDSPPILSGPDALILSALVDGIVMVVESGKTALKEIEEARALMPEEKFLGFVLNRSPGPYQGT